jgi:hypothetical protein
MLTIVPTEPSLPLSLTGRFISQIVQIMFVLCYVVCLNGSRSYLRLTLVRFVVHINLWPSVDRFVWQVCFVQM